MRDLDALRTVVQQATPGPWKLIGSCVTDWDDATRGYTMEWMSNGDYPNHKNDAAYLAVFNPEVVGALLDRIEAAEREWTDVVLTPSAPVDDEDDGLDAHRRPGESPIETAVRWTREYLETFHPDEPAEVRPDGNQVRVRFQNAGPILPSAQNGHQIVVERWLGDAF